MFSLKLEPIDMAIHGGIAFVATLLLGLVGNPWSVAFCVIALFFVREQVQQVHKNVPPSKPWFPWQWGPRGIAEWVVTIPAAIGGAYAATAFQ